ncbi:hypothetical protein C8A03DRAFT_38899, partial [Achaetomium macrosporum]
MSETKQKLRRNGESIAVLVLIVIIEIVRILIETLDDKNDCRQIKTYGATA